MNSKERRFLFRVEETIVGLAAVCLIVAACLPWGTAADYSASGMIGDGKITIAIGIIALILLSINLLVKIHAVVPLILGIIALVIGIIDFCAMYTATLETEAHIGIGLYLTILAAIGIITGSIIDLVRKS